MILDSDECVKVDKIELEVKYWLRKYNMNERRELATVSYIPHLPLCQLQLGGKLSCCYNEF
jgi:hypothetical protein